MEEPAIKQKVIDGNPYVKVEKAFFLDQSQIVGAVVAVIAVLITLCIYAIWQQRKNARRGILLVGLCDSGKTLIFSRLLHNRFVATHTSVKENSGDYLMNSNFLRIIDIPGHERLRGKFLDQFKSVARGVIFVVDSVTIQKEIRDVAELLYLVLSDSNLGSKSSHILIACNKQDQTLAKGDLVIKMLLEKEINFLRVTKTKQLNTTEGLANTNYLGILGKDFQFCDLPVDVQFAECTALNKDSDTAPDLDAIKNWLSTVA